MTAEAERIAAFEQIVQASRPALHRYCARMIGSVDGGEDVLQQALERAFKALPSLREVSAMRSWLFRTAHRQALDQLRRRARRGEDPLPEEGLPAAAEAEAPPLEQRELAALALRVFLRLPARQRSAVILKDVLDESLAETAVLLDATVPATKGCGSFDVTALFPPWRSFGVS